MFFYLKYIQEGAYKKSLVFAYFVLNGSAIFADTNPCYGGEFGGMSIHGKSSSTHISIIWNALFRKDQLQNDQYKSEAIKWVNL